jgi:restriction endonuclease Mrr
VTAVELVAWACKELSDNKWHPIKRVIEEYVLSNTLNSTDQAAEEAEQMEKDVTLSLEKLLEDDRKRGTPVRFEIGKGYIRITLNFNREIKASIDSLSGDDFEKLCTALVQKLGANAKKTGMKGDQGVDFMGEHISLGENFSLMPYKARPILFGQAKRYTGKVREPEVREFIAGALLRAKEHQVKNGLLCPVIYAFWTSSELDSRAKDACEEFGIWYIDGYGLSSLCSQLGIEPNLFKSQAQ